MRARCYQLRAIEGVLDRYKGDQRTLVVCPTGGGKTVIAGHLGQAFLEMNMGRVMVVAHREELINQAADKFKTITGVTASIEKAERWSDETSLHGAPPVVVASVQTLNSGGDGTERMRRFSPKDFAFLWIDEAHHATAESYRKVIRWFCMGNPKLKLLGMTATADRADGEMLGQHDAELGGPIFQSVAFDYALPDIIHDGYLVPISQRSVIIEGLEYSNVRTTAGDLNEADLENAMMMEEPLHGVAYATIEVCFNLERGTLRKLKDDPDRGVKLLAMLEGRRRRRTLVFNVTVEHAKKMAEILNRWIPGCADSVYSKGMTREIREKKFAAFREGKIQFLCNCGICTEGYDDPGVELVVMARPTKSRSLYCQMCGRGTRPLEEIAALLGTLDTAELRRKLIVESNKPYVEILDFVGNSGRHKLVTTADILGIGYSEEVIEAARKKSEAGDVDMVESLATAKEEAEQKKREEEKKKQEREEEEERKRQMEAARRARLVGAVDYDVEEVDAFDRYRPAVDKQHAKGAPENRPTDGMVRILLALGVKAATIADFTHKQAGKVIGVMKARGVQPDWSRVPKDLPAPQPSQQPMRAMAMGERPTPAQQLLLSRRGYTSSQISGMDFNAAARALRDHSNIRSVA
jgi:superfamily II DNA or RNA helicase